MQLLKQSTAATIVIGPFVDDADGKTAETGLTISQADVLLHKSDGTSIAQKNDATAATHRSSGYYTVPLNATDTGTLGRLRVMVSEGGALPVFHDFMVVTPNTYDALVSGSDYLSVDTMQIEGADATNQIRDSVVDDATRIDASALNTLSSHDPGENIMGATDLGTGAGLTSLASAANLAAVKTKTDNLPASPAAVGSQMDLVNAPNATALGAIADKFLGRSLAGGADGGRTVRQALRALRNKVTRSGSTLTVYQEDDSTSDWTATLSTSASADPITGIDPS